MKKILVLLILSMLSASLSAQTKKLHVLGFTLGETKSGTITNSFKEEGARYESDFYVTGNTGQSATIIELKNEPYIGVTWDLVRFTCKNYVLMKVEFIRVVTATSRETVVSVLKNTNREIRQRYGNSIIPADYLPWDPAKNSDDVVWRTKDGSNWIETTYFYTGKGDDYSLCLTFYDIKVHPEYKDKIKIEESSENDSGDGLDDLGTSAETEMTTLNFRVGETTCSGLIDYFENKGIHYEKKSGHYNSYIEVEHMLFIDEIWDYIRFECQNGKLMQVEFLNVIKTRELVISELNKTNLAIREIYGNEIKEADHLPWKNDKFDKDTVWKTDDDSTWIETTYSSAAEGNNYTLKMTIYDKELRLKYKEDVDVIDAYENILYDDYGF